MSNDSADKSSLSLKTLVTRFIIVVIFGIAFGYIESAIVVYLREIFYPAGFTFPLPHAFDINPLWKRLLLTEIGREAATLVLILIAAWLFGQNSRQRFACSMIIFAAWDIFYYVWLKALLNWPASILDWDILFLIPAPWAGPVLAPVLVSLAMLVFAWVILYRDYINKPLKASAWDWFGFSLAGFVVVLSFILAGRFMTAGDYASHFSWPLFLTGILAAIAFFTKCLLK